MRMDYVWICFFFSVQQIICWKNQIFKAANTELIASAENINFSEILSIFSEFRRSWLENRFLLFTQKTQERETNKFNHLVSPRVAASKSLLEFPHTAKYKKIDQKLVLCL